MNRYDILLVDDNVQLLSIIGEALKGKGYRVTKVSSGEGAIGMLLKRSFDLVITDFNMKRVSGFDVLKKSKEMSPNTPVMIITGNTDAGVYDSAMQLGADDLMWKPFSLKEFWGAVEHWIAKSEKRGRVREYPMLNAQNNKTDTHADVAPSV